MKILFLDDNFERHAAFNSAMSNVLKGGVGNHEVYHAFDADQAVSFLIGHKFDLVFLDHDLSVEDQLADPDKPTKEKTGAVVADYIASMPEGERPSRAVTHSFNPPGALKIVRILGNVGIYCKYVPFDARALVREIIS